MHIVLFDIDGTLLLTGGAGHVAIEHSLRGNFGIEQPAQVAIHGQTDRGIAKSLFEKHGIEDSQQSWELFRELYLGHLPQTLQSCAGHVLPGTIEMLSALHGRPDVAIGLLTGNTRTGAYRKLQHYGIDQYFFFGGFGDDYACRNEVAHSALRSAAEFLKIEPDPKQTWVIGDTPNDIICARSIGANVVAVATGSFSFEELESHQPNVCFPDLSDWQRVVRIVLGEE